MGLKWNIKRIGTIYGTVWIYGKMRNKKATRLIEWHKGGQSFSRLSASGAVVHPSRSLFSTAISLPRVYPSVSVGALLCGCAYDTKNGAPKDTIFVSSRLPRRL